MFAAGCAVLTALSGCFLFPHHAVTDPTADLESAPPADSATAHPPAPVRKKTATRRPPAAKTQAEPDTTRLAAAPDTTAGLTITVAMSPKERAEKMQLLLDETKRAAQALEVIRNKPLTAPQKDQLADADRFLAEAYAANEALDLDRACTLAAKARILAEGLAKNFR